MKCATRTLAFTILFLFSHSISTEAAVRALWEPVATTDATTANEIMRSPPQPPQAASDEANSEMVKWSQEMAETAHWMDDWARQKMAGNPHNMDDKWPRHREGETTKSISSRQWSQKMADETTNNQAGGDWPMETAKEETTNERKFRPVPMIGMVVRPQGNRETTILTMYGMGGRPQTTTRETTNQIARVEWPHSLHLPTLMDHTPGCKQFGHVATKRSTVKRHLEEGYDDDGDDYDSRGTPSFDCILRSMRVRELALKKAREEKKKEREKQRAIAAKNADNITVLKRLVDEELLTDLRWILVPTAVVLGLACVCLKRKKDLRRRRKKKKEMAENKEDKKEVETSGGTKRKKRPESKYSQQLSRSNPRDDFHNPIMQSNSNSSSNDNSNSNSNSSNDDSNSNSSNIGWQADKCSFFASEPAFKAKQSTLTPSDVKVGGVPWVKRGQAAFI